MKQCPRPALTGSSLPRRRLGRGFCLPRLEILEDRTVLSPVLYGSDGNAQLFTVDAPTGRTNVIGNTSAIMDDIAFTPDGKLYGVDNKSDLYQIDPTSAISTRIGSLGVTANALVSSASGQLYAAGSHLYSLNVSTGQATTIGAKLPDASSGDLAFDAQGTLYLSTLSDNLATLDPTTGAETILGPIGFTNVHGLALGSDGKLYGLTQSQKVITLNTTTGAGTLVSSYTGGFVGQARGAATPFATPAYALNLTSGTFTSLPATIQTYSATGIELGSLTVPIPAGTFFNSAVDVAVDQSGKIYVANANGNFNGAVLNIYDPATATWSARGFAGWSDDGDTDNGLTVFQNYVYATDAGTSGIVRFDVVNNTAQRFANGNEYTRVNIGLDGVLYGLNEFSNNVDVYDPNSMNRLRTITTPAGNLYQGVAVNGAGDIFLSTFGNKILELNPSGSLLSTITLPNLPTGAPPTLFNINIGTDGSLVGGGFDWSFLRNPAGNVVYLHSNDDSFANFATYQLDQSTHLAFVQQPPNGTAGQALKPAVTVAVEDANGNVSSLNNSLVTLTVATGPGQLQGTPVTAQAVNGIATFNNLILNQAGTYTLQASDGSLSPATSNSFTVSAGQPTQLAFETNPPNGVAGQALPDIKVDLLDAFGNLTSSTAAVSIGANGPGNFASPVAPINAVNGVADFTGLVLQTAGTYTLAADSPGLPTTTSTPFTISAAAPSQLAFVTTPATSTAGQTIPDIKVEVDDAFGNRTSSTAAVTIQASGPGSFTAGTNPVSAVNGLADFADLVLQIAGSYTLTASATGLTAAPPVNLVVKAAAASQLAFPASLPDVAAGQVLPVVPVSLLDPFGNQSTGSLAISIQANGPAPFASGTFTVAAVNGVANFRDLVLALAGSYTLTASSPRIAQAANSPSFNVLPANAKRLTFEADPTGAVAGQPLADIRVDVRDVQGNLTNSSATVTLNVNGPGAFVGGTPTAQAVNGIATFHGLVLQTAGSYKVTANATGMVPATTTSFPITPAAGSTLALVGTLADGVAGAALGDIQVKVLDAFGNLTASTASVNLVLAGPATLSAGPASVAAVAGVATFTGLVLQTAGSYTLTATSTGLLPTSPASFLVHAAAPAQLVLENNPTDTVAGQPLADIKVDLLDAFGNLTSATDSLQIDATGPGAFTAGTTSLPAVNGVATFHGLVLQKAGSYTISVSDPGTTGATSSSFTIVPAAPSQLVFQTPPADGTAGAALGNIQVAILDSFGNLTTSIAPVTITASGPGDFTGGAPTSVPAANGIATFQGLTIAKAGSYTIAAGATGLAPTAPASFTIQPAQPTQLVLEASPTGGVAGQPLADVKVDLLDPFGNLSNSNVVVSINVSGPGNLVGNFAAAPAVGAVADFNSLVLQTAGTYTLTASASGLTSATSSKFTISPAAASQLTIVSVPTSGSAGLALPDVQVDLLDAFGNLSNSNVPVTITATGPGAFSAGASSVAAGVADFTNVVLTKAGTYTLTVSSAGLTPATSGNLLIGPSSAGQLVFLAPPADGTAGQPLADIQVQLLDAFGNLTSSTEPVSITVTGPGNFTSGVTSVQAMQGVATFTGLVLQKAGSYNLHVSGAGLNPADSLDFTVNPAAVSQILVQTSATTVIAGQPLPPLSVQTLDPFGNPVGGVTVSVSAGGPGSLASGTVTALSSPQGVATFSGLILQQGGNYALNFNTAGLATVSTDHLFNITPAIPTKLAFEPNVAPAAAGQPVPDVKIDVEDAFGNLVPTTSFQVTLTIKGPGAPPPLLATTTAGVADFKGVNLTKAGSYTFSASTPGLSAATTPSFTVGAAAAGQVNFVAQPANVVAGQPLPDLQVQVTDASGNPLSGVTLTVAVNGPGSLHSGATDVQSSNGTATFTGLVLQTAGSYTLTISAPGVGPLASSPFQVNPAAAGQLVVATTLPGATAGQALPALQVNVYDAFGNPISAAVPVSLTVNGPGALAAGSTTATTAAGVATFTGLVLQTAGSYTLTFSSPGLTAASTAPFTIAPADPASLAFVVNPPGNVVTAGQTLPTIAVNILDAFGNATAVNVPVTLQIAGPGAPAADTTVQASSGTATFTGLSLPQAGSYTMTVAGPNLASVTSTPFTVAPVTAASAPSTGGITITALPTSAGSSIAATPIAAPATITHGTPVKLRALHLPITGHAKLALPALSFRVLDASGRPVSGIVVHVRLKTGHLGGILQVRTDASGKAAFKSLKIAKPGTYSLIVTVARLKATFNRSIVVRPA